MQVASSVNYASFMQAGHEGCLYSVGERQKALSSDSRWIHLFPLLAKNGLFCSRFLSKQQEGVKVQPLSAMQHGGFENADTFLEI